MYRHRIIIYSLIFVVCFIWIQSAAAQHTCGGGRVTIQVVNPLSCSQSCSETLLLQENGSYVTSSVCAEVICTRHQEQVYSDWPECDGVPDGTRGTPIPRETP